MTEKRPGSRFPRHLTTVSIETTSSFSNQLTCLVTPQMPSRLTRRQRCLWRLYPFLSVTLLLTAITRPCSNIISLETNFVINFLEGKLQCAYTLFVLRVRMWRQPQIRRTVAPYLSPSTSPAQDGASLKSARVPSCPPNSYLMTTFAACLLSSACRDGVQC